MQFNILDKFRKKMVQYVISYNYGKPIWTNTKDEDYVKEAYNKIVWVYACVSMISSCVSTIPWCLYRKKPNGDLQEIEDHPILNIVNKNINPYFSSKDFFDLWATYLALQGKFYAQYNNSALPTQIYTLYPHNVRPIPDMKNFVSGFEYKIGNDKTILKPEEVMWSRFNDPLDIYNGLSPIKALARTIDTENEAVDWNKKSLENNAVPVGAIQVTNPSPEISEKLRKDWLERYSGKNNVRVPLVLNSDKASYVNFGLSPIDMDFLNQRKVNRIEICSAFGVPSQVVGDPEGQTYANYSEAQKSFWENTIIPRYLDTMEYTLNANLVQKYADNLILKYDLDNVQVLHESIDSISERVRNLFKDNLITQNEGRYSLGYEELPEGNIFYFDISKRMMDSMTSSDTDTDTDTDKEEEEEKKLNIKKKSLNMTKDKKIEYWKDYDNQRIKYEKYLEKKIQELYKKEQKQVSELNSTLKSYYKDIVKVIDKNKVKWQSLYLAFYVAVVKEFGDKVWNDLKKTKSLKTDGFDVYEESIQAYIKKTTAEQVRRITDTSKQTIKASIQKGIDEGLEIREIRDWIQESYDAFSTSRATTIARTETIGASNYGSLASAEQSETNVKKIWIATYDKRTRPHHSKADSHPPIPLNETFKVGSSELMYPADPDGFAEDVINCRCAIGYVDGD